MIRGLAVMLGSVLIPLGLFCALFGSYFAWKFFAVYLPNKASVDACIPSGGTCSIDGIANLELSGGMMAFFVGIAFVCFVASFFLLRSSRARQSKP
jgi:hypothetical protein